MKQLIYDNITDKRSIPFNSAGTGTIATHGIAIVGTGTLFKTEMPAGSYLVDLTAWELFKVYRVDSDTLAFLEIAFTADIAPGTSPEIIKAFQCKVKEISLSTAGSILLNNKAFTGSDTIGKTGNSKSSRNDLIDPIIVDATGTTLQVQIINF